MRPRRRAAVVIVSAGALIAAGVHFGRPLLDRRHDVAAQRSIYRAFPVLPGAVKTSERTYEVKSDGRGTGDYGLTVVYRVPSAVSSSDVIGFVRRSIPPGWREASDDDCARPANNPPRPRPTTPDGATMPLSSLPSDMVLTLRRSQLTVFKPEQGPGSRRVAGVTFTLSGTGAAKRLTLDAPTYSCQPAGFPDDDKAADLFDSSR